MPAAMSDQHRVFVRPTKEQIESLLVLLATDRISGELLQEFLERYLPEPELDEYETVSAFHDLVTTRRAKAIMGEDIIFPVEITGATGLHYTEGQYCHLMATLPAENTLRWCRNNDFIVTAGPPKPMNLIDIYHLESKLFYSLEQYMITPAVSGDHIATRWFALNKNGYIPSKQMNYYEAERSIQTAYFETHRIPNIAEVAWCMVIFQKIRQRTFFVVEHMRTSTRVDNLSHAIIFNIRHRSRIRVEQFTDASENCIGLSMALAFNLNSK